MKVNDIVLHKTGLKSDQAQIIYYMESYWINFCQSGKNYLVDKLCAFYTELYGSLKEFGKVIRTRVDGALVSFYVAKNIFGYTVVHAYSGQRLIRFDA